MPDQLTYLLGDAIVFQLTATLDFMPAVVMCCIRPKSCALHSTLCIQHFAFLCYLSSCRQRCWFGCNALSQWRHLRA